MVISPKGVLYALTGDSILRIAADGVATRVPVVSDPVGNGGLVKTFNPFALAFEPNGDFLVVSGYYLVQLSPAGVITPIVHISTFGLFDGMTTSPSGNVLMAQEPGELQRVTSAGQDVSNHLAGPNNRLPPGQSEWRNWSVDIGDMVVAPDGTIYAVASDEAPSVNVTQLIRIPAAGRASVLPITTPLQATLPKLGSDGTFRHRCIRDRRFRGAVPD